MNIKHYSVLLAILLLNISCNESNSQKNDLEKENLNGNVKSITVNEYQAVEKFGEIIKGERVPVDRFSPENKKIVYNQYGNLLEGYFGEVEKYQYNGKNQLVSIKYTTSNSVRTYKYDEKNNVVEENIYNNDTLFGKTKFIYDDDGNKIEENVFNFDGSLYFKVKNRFENKKNIESIKYDSAGKLWSISNYKYDNNGNLFFNKDVMGNYETISKYVFDSDNNILESIVTNNYSSIRKVKYKFKYTKYDLKRNWLEKIDFIDDIPVKICVREIIYY
jgi:hypothetical protein